MSLNDNRRNETSSSAYANVVRRTHLRVDRLPSPGASDRSRTDSRRVQRRRRRDRPTTRSPSRPASPVEGSRADRGSRHRWRLTTMTAAAAAEAGEEEGWGWRPRYCCPAASDGRATSDLVVRTLKYRCGAASERSLFGHRRLSLRTTRNTVLEITILTLYEAVAMDFPHGC